MQWKLHDDEEVCAEPYSALADLYDHLMDHVNYSAWADYILVLCHRNGHVPKMILELACGTGSLMQEFFRRGFFPYGVDQSMPMLKTAQNKLSHSGYCSNLIRSDILAIPVKARFDTIICMYDSMNYLSSTEDIGSTVRSILSILPGGGVLIFDMCTEYNSLKHFNGTSSSGQYGQYLYTRNSFYKKEGKIQFTEFAVKNRKSGEAWKERHVQHIYPFSDIHTAITDTIASRIYMFKDYTLDPPDEKCERVHFIVEKV